MSDPAPDPYAVLQVARHAEPDVVQAAYRALARRFHPDRSADPSAQARMAELNRAWETLGDSTRRAEYDRTHPVGSRPSAFGTTRSTAGDGRAERPASAPSWSRSAGGRASTDAAGPTPEGPTWRLGPNGEGAAGPPPGNPSGTVLDFGRHIGWSMGEIARIDPGYLEWLERQPSGRRHREEIDRTLRRTGHRFDREARTGAPRRRGR